MKFQGIIEESLQWELDPSELEKFNRKYYGFIAGDSPTKIIDKYVDDFVYDEDIYNVLDKITRGCYEYEIYLRDGILEVICRGNGWSRYWYIYALNKDGNDLYNDYLINGWDDDWGEELYDYEFIQSFTDYEYSPYIPYMNIGDLA